MSPRWQQLGMESDSIDIVSTLLTAHGHLGDEDGLWILLFPNLGRIVLRKERMGTMVLEVLHFSKEWSVRELLECQSANIPEELE